MPEDFERRVVVELDPGLDAEGHQLLRLDVGEEEVRSPAFVRRNRHRAENVSGATRETLVVGCSREGPAPAPGLSLTQVRSSYATATPLL